MSYRIAVDTGGTFTDVLVADSRGCTLAGKALTTPERMFRGAEAALAQVAGELELSVRGLLEESWLFLYGTTRATNAVLVGHTARTAFLTTKGLPDVLTLREGGKSDAFDFSSPYPEPYVSRDLTFEVPGRINSEGLELDAVDLGELAQIIEGMRKRRVEAVAVCLVWSIANPKHELLVGERIAASMPGLPFTLSHRLNPTIREYRRGSCAAIDASLKPLMQRHLGEIGDDLREAGFGGELLVLTSSGGATRADDVAERPIFSVNSGPSMGPVAARAVTQRTHERVDAVVCDAGGTSFDVSLVEGGRIRTTRDTWLGKKWHGHLTGLPAVDVRSIGAGGGSIAWIDSGGLLRVGPQSAGALPGPACYARGGQEPTVTDAALLLGYLDPDYFLGGRMQLDRGGSVAAIREVIADPIGLDVEHAAAAIIRIATEQMVGAIREITVGQGVDPRECLLVAGGGAGGLNAADIARELEMREIVIPKYAGTLSASGALVADIVASFGASHLSDSRDFEFERHAAVVELLRERLRDFGSHLPTGAVAEVSETFAVEARYPLQVWELSVPLAEAPLETEEDVERLAEAFHGVHEATFAVSDRSSPVEFQHWSGQLTATLRGSDADRSDAREPMAHELAGSDTRSVVFASQPHGPMDARRILGSEVGFGQQIEGPAIIHELHTTLVVPPGWSVRVTKHRDYFFQAAEMEDRP